MQVTKLTKIVATLGPSSESEEVIIKLIEAGVNVFRFNTKHSTPEWHSKNIEQVQSIADKLGVTIGILLDLQGPEIRLETKDKKDIAVSTGQIVRVGYKFDAKTDIIIPHAGVFNLLKPGSELLIDDGFVETYVDKVDKEAITIVVGNDAVIKDRKGVNLPGIDLDLPSLVENDFRQLDINAKNKVDFIGLSFVRSKKDIEILQMELKKRNISAQVVAKIENEQALNNIDEIIDATDALMVARGDLGVEVPIERLPYWQKTLIAKCREKNKPVITATQILESMIQNPRPTRAEATDIAHAIFDGTDAIMLSAESASGKYPVRAVETMAKIAKYNESIRNFDTPLCSLEGPTHMVTDAAVKIAKESKDPVIGAIIVFTETGYTARSVARHRLSIPTIALTDSTKTKEALTLSYGVIPIKTDFPTGPYDSPKQVLNDLVKANILKRGESVVVVHGNHWQKPGNTNALAIIEL